MCVHVPHMCAVDMMCFKQLPVFVYICLSSPWPQAYPFFVYLPVSSSPYLALENSKCVLEEDWKQRAVLDSAVGAGGEGSREVGVAGRGGLGSLDMDRHAPAH